MDRHKLLEKYLRGSNILTEEVRLLHPDIIDFRPDLPEAWTIREHVAHLADLEVNRFLWINPVFRELLGDDNPDFPRGVDWGKASLEQCLDALMAARELVYDYLGAAEQSSGGQIFQIQKSDGSFMERTTDECITLLDQHLRAHHDYIERNVAAHGAVGVEGAVEIDLDGDDDGEDEGADED